MTVPPRPSQDPEIVYDCVIIGAGFAGLSAAADLEAPGCSVLLAEARDRVGGRVEAASLAGHTVDRSAEPRDGDIVVAALDGAFTVKRLKVTGRNGGRRVWLVAENEAYPAVEVLEGHELVIWGVVAHVVHKCR